MVNKHALEGTLAFVSALASSESLPTEMKTDVGHIQRLLMADTDQCSIEFVEDSLTILERLRKSAEQKLT